MKSNWPTQKSSKEGAFISWQAVYYLKFYKNKLRKSSPLDGVARTSAAKLSRATNVSYIPQFAGNHCVICFQCEILDRTRQDFDGVGGIGAAGACVP